MLPASFGIVDLFAGPGGLGEGFAAFETDGHAPFHLGISVEKESSAHATLRLRSFLRGYQKKHGNLPTAFVEFHAGLRSVPDWSEVDAEVFEAAAREARCLELGTNAATEAIDQSIKALRTFDDTILIGGPPCQAYSLAGRARARGNEGYIPEDDHRHYLFREYIGVLDRLRPAAFVMENVKGMLSSTVESRLAFEMLMEDLASVGRGRGHGYQLFAIRLVGGNAILAPAARPSDFVVHADRFGVPQRRHRVIVAGIRADLSARAAKARIEPWGGPATVADAIEDLPKLRSGISRCQEDSFGSWRQAIGEALNVLKVHGNVAGDELANAEQKLNALQQLPRDSGMLPEGYGSGSSPLLQWIERPEMLAIAQHETRSHMISDLGRYLFSSIFGRMQGFSPKARDFPQVLRPNHRNWECGIFNDRFRVQIAGEPSTTVTSHIAKDGHYFIHPDPVQCRSLTVREAARRSRFIRMKRGMRMPRVSAPNPVAGKSGMSAERCQLRRP